MHRLAEVFKVYGYEGASLATISRATGLKKPSLYHRFPGGKEQMAQEVLAFADAWIEENLLRPLRDNGSPRERAQVFAGQIAKLYRNGKDSCLLNMLSVTKAEANPFESTIRATFQRLGRVLTAIAIDAGFERPEARRRAEEVLVVVQGALVVARGTGSTAVFRRAKERIPRVLLD